MTEPRRTRRAEPTGQRKETGDGGGEPFGGGGDPFDGASVSGATSDWERIRAGAQGPAWHAGGVPPPRAGVPDLSPLLALLDSVRAVLPRELEQQFTALLREALLTLRALIDWYLERLDGSPSERRVEDIPIE